MLNLAALPFPVSVPCPRCGESLRGILTLIDLGSPEWTYVFRHADSSGTCEWEAREGSLGHVTVRGIRRHVAERWRRHEWAALSAVAGPWSASRSA
jgi:hypothetical protein